MLNLATGMNLSMSLPNVHGGDKTDIDPTVANWTSDLSKAHLIAQRLQAATHYYVDDVVMLLGGYKQSSLSRKMGVPHHLSLQKQNRRA